MGRVRRACLRVARARVRRKKRLNWWLIYGSTRSGTTYMTRQVEKCAALVVGDWGLAAILGPLPDYDYIRFDYSRFLRDVSRNILRNARGGGGRQLDLVFKQAGLSPGEYNALIAMWGPPARTIFCLREPAGYVASARRKFTQVEIGEVQRSYVEAIDRFLEIGGEVFEYAPGRTSADYEAFLEPLRFDRDGLDPFAFRGREEPERVTPEMTKAYQRVLTRFKADSVIGGGVDGIVDG